MKQKSIRHKAIRLIEQILRERYQPEKIVLFGSSSTGRLKPGSDIDLLIVKKTNQPFFRRLVEVRSLVSRWRKGIPFDPIVVTPQELSQRLARGDQFLADILRSGKVLYARP